ncbi:hypothetical protein MIR68_004525 [Amoeboaphelidium protococcarum]|nr:hypothetical protein MIR68_004525 [Amoeboaphelidium protococcarum]KAI3654809.1 hypothetical protein MP228_000189 [Amoeboaphelidium protococcarum]
MKYQLLTAAFAMLAMAQKAAVGDFAFENPPRATLVTKVPVIRAGSTFHIKWRTDPVRLGNPETITLEYRVGVYPNQSDFMALITNVPNQNSYDWQVPADTAENIFMFRISSTQTNPLIRARISSPIRIIPANATGVSDLNPIVYDDPSMADGGDQVPLDGQSGGEQQPLNDKNNINNTSSTEDKGTANSAVDGISQNVLSVVLVGFASLILA